MGAAKASTQVSCTRLIQIKNGRDRRCLDGSPIPGRRINSVVSNARQKGGFFATILLRYTQSGNAITWIHARGLGATIRKRIEEAFGWIKTVAGQEKTRFQSHEIVGRRGEGEGKADAADTPLLLGNRIFPAIAVFIIRGSWNDRGERGVRNNRRNRRRSLSAR